MSAVGIVTVLHDSAQDLQRLLRSLEPRVPARRSSSSSTPARRTTAPRSRAPSAPR